MYHLAVDIGASSGRVIVGQLLNDRLSLQEIYRFSNHFTINDGKATWDLGYLLKELLSGLEKAKKMGIDKCSVGIDTWAVDYVLLDDQDRLMQSAYCYRDERTNGTMEKFFQQLPKEVIYNKTGIQFLSFNTLFQLYEESPEMLQQTKSILLVPDYLNFCLTGEKRLEITNASTTQLLNIHERDFDTDLLDLLNIKRHQFPNFIEPGTKLGALKRELFPTFDLPDAEIVAVASHDTASAVLGTPGQNNWAYLSSGTWSLVGVELTEPIINKQSLTENYTNEYGAFQTYRYLKNVMGLWVIQEVQRLLEESLSFEDLVKLAKKEKPFQQFINLNDERFLNPANMIKEIQAYCHETNQPVPITASELAAAVYHNLAIIIAHHIDHIEAIVNQPIDYIHIVGGGSKNNYLNELIAIYSKRIVFAGPTEATAIGNIVIQLITYDRLQTMKEARQLIAQSFDIQQIEPKELTDQHLFHDFYTAIGRGDQIK